jgi:thymidylate synthase
LDIVKEVIESGTEALDRIQVDTLSGGTMHFDLWDSFPLLTTKKVLFRGVVEGTTLVYRLASLMHRC